MPAAASAVLVPGPLRRPVAVVVAVAAVVFAVLAIRYAGTTGAGHVDVRVDAVLDPLGAAHRRLFDQVLLVGSPPSVVVLTVVLAALCRWRGRRRFAVLAVVGPGLTGLCTTALKPVLGRTLGGEFAYPSGHTGGATSIALVAALLVISLCRPRRGSALAILAAVTVVLGGGVGVAMIAVNAHYPTDVMGGFCTAVVVVCGSALVLDRIAEARSAATADQAEGPATPGLSP